MAVSLRAWQEHDADRALALAVAKGLGTGASRPHDDNLVVELRGSKRRATDVSGLPTLRSESSSPPKQTCTSPALLQPTVAEAGPSGSSRMAQDVRELAARSRLAGRIDVDAPAGAHGKAERVLEQPAAARLHGCLGKLAATEQWQKLYEELVSRDCGAFVTGGPGVGKPTILRGFIKALRVRWPRLGEVVVVAPTASAAKTAKGQTYHSLFGFPRGYDVHLVHPVIEAARLLKEKKYRVISRRLAAVRVATGRSLHGVGGNV